MNKNKCPVCGKTFDKSWKVVNHMRQSRTQGHGPMGELPDTDEVQQYLELIGKKTKEPSNTEEPTENNSNNEPFQIQKINPPQKKQSPKIDNCPDCGTPKTEWITTDQAFLHGINMTEQQQKEFDYVCPSCKELIKVKSND